MNARARVGLRVGLRAGVLARLREGFRAGFRVGAICVLLGALAGLVLLVVRPNLNPAHHIQPLPLIALGWVAFLTAAFLLRKVPVRLAVALILLGGIGIQIAAVSAPPRQSDDVYRYVWDGRVQAAGLDPYAYVPAAARLDSLRDSFLWHRGAGHCLSPAFVGAHASSDLVSGCTLINRPSVPTIYPPVAEAYYLAVHYEPAGDSSTTPIQATTAFVAVLVTVLLLFGLGRLGRDVRMAALWSWCPTVALEAGNSAHVDVVAVGIAAAALLVLATARSRLSTVFGAVLLGLAIATKVTPALVVPAVLRRRWMTVVVSAASAFVVVYVPHLLAVGSKVIGFLPGYLQQEGYENGTRFGIIGLVLTGKLALAMAVLILAAAAFAVLQFSDPDRPWQGAVFMTAAALAVTTPRYQWYALLLVMLVALDGRPEWLAFAAGAYYAAEPNLGRYTIPNRLHDAVAYGVPVAVVAAGWLVREVVRRRGGVGLEPAAVPVPVPVGAAVAASSAFAGPITVTAPVLAPAAVSVSAAVSAPASDEGSWPAGVGAFLPVGYP